MGRMILEDTRAPERRSRNRTDFYYPFNRTSVRLLDVARGIRGPNPDLSVDDLAYCRLIPVDVNFVADQIISVDRKTQVPTPVPGQGARFDGCGRVGGDDLHKVVWGGGGVVAASEVAGSEAGEGATILLVVGLRRW